VDCLVELRCRRRFPSLPHSGGVEAPCRWELVRGAGGLPPRSVEQRRHHIAGDANDEQLAERRVEDQFGRDARLAACESLLSSISRAST
jgi:hypothetical protein